VDATLEMDIGKDLEHLLMHAIDSIVHMLGLPHPDAALAKVHRYKPVHTTNAKKTEAKAQATPRYFGLLTEIDLAEALVMHISRQEGGGALGAIWGVLKKNRCIVHKPCHNRAQQAAPRDVCVVGALHRTVHPAAVLRSVGACGGR
jgi:hypothetical protein